MTSSGLVNSSKGGEVRRRVELMGRIVECRGRAEARGNKRRKRKGRVLPGALHVVGSETRAIQKHQKGTIEMDRRVHQVRSAKRVTALTTHCGQSVQCQQGRRT